MHPPSLHSSFFFFNDTATTEIYTLSLHDALPISPAARAARPARYDTPGTGTRARATRTRAARRAPRRPPRRSPGAPGRRRPTRRRKAPRAWGTTREGRRARAAPRGVASGVEVPGGAAGRPAAGGRIGLGAAREGERSGPALPVRAAPPAA